MYKLLMIYLVQLVEASTMGVKLTPWLRLPLTSVLSFALCLKLSTIHINSRIYVDTKFIKQNLR